jgi:hypothetical protein
VSDRFTEQSRRLTAGAASPSQRPTVLSSGAPSTPTFLLSSHLFPQVYHSSVPFTCTFGLPSSLSPSQVYHSYGDLLQQEFRRTRSLASFFQGLTPTLVAVVPQIAITVSDRLCCQRLSSALPLSRWWLFMRCVVCLMSVGEPAATLPLFPFPVLRLSAVCDVRESECRHGVGAACCIAPSC